MHNSMFGAVCTPDDDDLCCMMYAVCGIVYDAQCMRPNVDVWCATHNGITDDARCMLDDAWSMLNGVWRTLNGV